MWGQPAVVLLASLPALPLSAPSQVLAGLRHVSPAFWVEFVCLLGPVL